MSAEFLMRFPGTCTHEVTRNHEMDACGKPAIAAVWDVEGDPYPVCKHHAHLLPAPSDEIRINQLLTLSELIALIRDEVDVPRDPQPRRELS